MGSMKKSKAMKIRIKGDSIRFRLTRTEVETLCKNGYYEEVTHLNGAFFCAQRFGRVMLEAGSGSIINIASMSATISNCNASYNASKAGVVQMTRMLAAEWGRFNINVNCILPGTIDTPQNRADMPDADFGKWVPPAALADVVVFLASDAARCISGAAIPVYGQS